MRGFEKKMQEWKQQIRKNHRQTIKEEKRQQFQTAFCLEKVTNQLIHNHEYKVEDALAEIQNLLRSTTINQITNERVIKNLSYMSDRFLLQLKEKGMSSWSQRTCIRILCCLTTHPKICQFFDNQTLIWICEYLTKWVQPSTFVCQILLGIGNLLTINFESRNNILQVLSYINIEHILFLALEDLLDQENQQKKNSTLYIEFDEYLRWFIFKYAHYKSSYRQNHEHFNHLQFGSTLLRYLKVKLQQLVREMNQKKYREIATIIYSFEIQISYSCIQSSIVPLLEKTWNLVETAKLFYSISQYKTITLTQKTIEDILLIIAYNEDQMFKKRNIMLLTIIYKALSIMKDSQSMKGMWYKVYEPELKDILEEKAYLSEELTNIYLLTGFD